MAYQLDRRIEDIQIKMLATFEWAITKSTLSCLNRIKILLRKLDILFRFYFHDNVLAVSVSMYLHLDLLIIIYHEADTDTK